MAKAGGRGLTPTQGQVLALLRANPDGLRWVLEQSSSASPPSHVAGGGQDEGSGGSRRVALALVRLRTKVTRRSGVRP